MRGAPRDARDYLAAEHVTVAYEAHRGLELDRQLAARGVHRRFAVRVPGFAALPAFVCGTPLLTTAPSLLARTALSALASAPVPIDCPRLPMYLVWHMRYQQDAAHQWLRAQLEAVVVSALALEKA